MNGEAFGDLDLGERVPEEAKVMRIEELAREQPIADRIGDTSELVDGDGDECERLACPDCVGDH